MEVNPVFKYKYSSIFSIIRKNTVVKTEDGWKGNNRQMWEAGRASFILVYLLLFMFLFLVSFIFFSSLVFSFYSSKKISDLSSFTPRQWRWRPGVRKGKKNQTGRSRRWPTDMAFRIIQAQHSSTVVVVMALVFLLHASAQLVLDHLKHGQRNRTPSKKTRFLPTFSGVW